jgi:hypothetical protein
LVALVAGTDLGSVLKKRQYKQAEYAKTELGVNIAPIADSVRARLEKLRATGGQNRHDPGMTDAVNQTDGSGS